MRRVAVLGAMTAACAALLLVLPVLRRSSAVRGDRPSSEPARHDAPVSPGAAQARRGDDGAAADASASAEPSRDAVAATAASAPTCLVRVVDATTKAPVPEARVWIQREDVGWDDPEWWRAMRRFNDVEPVLQSGLGEEHALDARGTLRVPRPGRALSVAAALGDQHGEAELGPDDAECVVELERYHALTVEVVDRAGEPVPDAFVALFWGELDPLEGSHFLPTDDDGRLFVPKLEAQIWDEDYRGTLRLTLAGGVPCTPEIVELSMEDLPVEPVRLVAGDFGTVIVQLTDPFGRPQAVEGTAQLEIDTDSMDAASLAVHAGAFLYLPMRDGRAVFPCIGLDLPLSVHAQGGSWREVAGPTQPGETLEVLVPLAERMWTARIRVEGIDVCFPGADRARLQAGTSPADDRSGIGSFETWARNRVQEVIPIWSAYALERHDGPWDLELSSPAGFARTRRVPMRDLDACVLDFGAVRFEPEPVLVRVQVVDPAGEPIEYAGVEIEAGRRLSCDEGGGCAVTSGVAELPFRVRGRHHSWLPSEWVEVRGPGEDEVLALRRGARIEGRLLLPRGASADDFCIDLLDGDGTPMAFPDHRVLPVSDGRFRFDVCMPGTAVLRLEWDGRPVAERSGIVLVAGETTVLPAVDLRDVLHPFALTFELASGAPWREGHLEVREPDGTLTTWTRIGPGGRASFLAITASVDLWACGKGARPRLFEGVLDGDRLVLPDGYTLELRVSPSIELLEPPLVLMVYPWLEVPEGAFEPDGDFDMEAAAVEVDREVRLHVPSPGEYELEWYVLHTGTGVHFAVEPDEPQVVRVDEDAGDVVVDALLDAESVQRALRAARGE